MSDSVRPHRRQPTRLPRPWDSPGKNTGVGCHFLFHCMKVKSESEVVQSLLTLSDPMDCSLPGSSAHGIFQASTGVGCHCLLQYICIYTYNTHTLYIFFTYSSIYRHLVASFWAIVNNAEVNMGYRYHFELVFSFLQINTQK